MNKRFIVEGPHRRNGKAPYWTVVDKQIKSVIAMYPRKNDAWTMATDLERQWLKEVGFTR